MLAAFAGGRGIVTWREVHFPFAIAELALAGRQTTPARLRSTHNVEDGAGEIGHGGGSRELR